MAKFLAEVAAGTRFGVGLGFFLLLLGGEGGGRGGGGSIGNQDRGLPGGGLPVQISLRHEESDGWVVIGMDGLSLGQVLLDGPKEGWMQQDPGQ